MECRGCGQKPPEVKVEAETLTDVKTGKTQRVPLCRKCNDKARRNDLEIWQKLTPLLSN